MRTALRYLALLLAILAGCAAPLQHHFPLNQPARPAEVSEAAWDSTYVFTDGRFLCGAVLVAPDVALTARHCVEGPSLGLLVHPGGAVRAVTAAVVAVDADVAFLQVAPAAKQHAQVGTAPAPGARGHVLGYGCSHGMQLEARPVTYVGRFKPGRPDELLLDMWQGTACRGDSGGGVFDADGKLVGISVRIADSDDVQLLYTVPTDLVAPLLEPQAPLAD